MACTWPPEPSMEIWLAMTEAEREAQMHTPVLLRDRGWRME